MEKWLESCVPDVHNIYEYHNYLLEKNYNKTLTDYYRHYYNNDTDERSSIDHINKVNQYANKENHHMYTYNLEKYENKYIFIPPNTNRFHCMYLFRKMTDYCLEKKYSYNNNNLIYPEFKQYFYYFCFMNTSHKYDEFNMILYTPIPFKEDTDEDEYDEYNSDDEYNVTTSNINKKYDERADIVDNFTNLYNDIIHKYMLCPRAKILDKLNNDGYKQFLKFMFKYNVHYLAIRD